MRLSHALLLVPLVSVGCGGPVAMGEASSGSGGGSGSTGAEVVTGTGEVPTGGDTPALDLPSGMGMKPSRCDEDGCRLDILFVIDNTRTMAEEQARLLAAVPALIATLRDLPDSHNEPLPVSVNIMVTTTDMGHPLCGAVDGYAPALGGPVVTACSERLGAFAGEVPVPELCTDACPGGQTAADPFLHFDVDGDNVVGADGDGDPVVDALRCMLPQGVVGCGMEAPLAAMRVALDPGSAWNQGARPFVREDAVLAVIVVSDETDCSVAEDGFKFFDPKNVDDPALNGFWADVPGMPGVKQSPTSAICWHAGMSCAAGDSPGVYDDCVPEDKGVLRPVAEYEDFFAGLWGAGKPVVMLLLAGVPRVKVHNSEWPFEPQAGGIFDLEYHDWRDDDVLPGDVKTAAEQQFDLGIGPGCVGAPATQALPPGRLASVCRSLDVADDPNTDKNESRVSCHIESLCQDSYATPLNAFVGALAGPGRDGPAPG